MRFIAVTALVLAATLALACGDPEPNRLATVTPTATATPTVMTTPTVDEANFSEAEASAYGMDYLVVLIAQLDAWGTSSSGIERDPARVRDWRDATVALAEVEPHARAASCVHEVDDLLDDLLYDFALWLADVEAALLGGAAWNDTTGERILATIRQDILPILGICEVLLRAGAERE